MLGPDHCPSARMSAARADTRPVVFLSCLQRCMVTHTSHFSVSPVRGSWVGLGKHQTSEAPAKGAVGDAGRLLRSVLKAFGRLLFPKCPHYRYEIHPRCCEKPPVNRINCTVVLNPKHLLGLTSAARHTPGFIVEVIRLQLAGLFVELAAVQSK